MGDTQLIQGLVKDLQDGKETALAQLYDRFADALYGLILRIVRDDALAQDILQEAFVKIWQKAKTYSAEKGSFFTWMLNICRNRSIDELRKIERQPNGKIQITDTGVYKLNGSETNIETIGLKDMVAELPEKHRLMIEYLYFKGYTQKETSEALDLPLGTVKTRSRAALLTLGESFAIITLMWILKNT